MNKGSGRAHISCCSLVLAASLLAPVPAVEGLPPSEGTCYAVTTIATVCSLGSCTTTYYVDDYWCGRTASTDTVPDPHYRNPADADDQNLAIDNHRDVVKTSDQCAWQFDNGDRLGTNYGGTNTERPHHNGVDIQANLGDPVGVVGHGRITAVGWQNPNNHDEGCGYRMIVSHFNGDESVYCHLKANSAKFGVGRFVRAGTVIAAANSTGESSGDHLHLIYRQNGDEIEYWEMAGTQPTANELNGSC